MHLQAIGAILTNLVKVVTKVANKTAGKAAAKAIAESGAGKTPSGPSLMDSIFIGSMLKDRSDMKKQAKQQRRIEALNDIASITSQEQYDLLSKI